MLFLIEPSPSVLGMSSTLSTISTQSLSYSYTEGTVIIAYTYILSTAQLLLTNDTLISSMNNAPHITNIPSQSSHTLSSTVKSSSDDTASPPPTVFPSSTSVNDSLISNPSTTVSTEGTVQSSTVSNTLAAVISTVFILLVVTILVILIVSVLVYKRRHQKLSTSCNPQLDTSSTEKETELTNPTYQAQGNTINVFMQTCAEIRIIMNLI